MRSESWHPHLEIDGLTKAAALVQVADHKPGDNPDFKKTSEGFLWAAHLDYKPGRMEHLVGQARDILGFLGIYEKTKTYTPRQIMEAVVEDKRALRIQGIDEPLQGAFTTTAVAVLEYLGSQTGKGALSFVEEHATDPMVIAFCKPLVDRGFLEDHGGKRLSVAGEKGQDFVKKGGSWGLLAISYIELMRHANDIAAGRKTWRYKGDYFREQPQNVIASDKIIQIQVVPTVARALAESVAKSGIKHPKIIDCGGGSLKGLSLFAKICQDEYGIYPTIIDLDMDKGTETTANATMRRMGVKHGYWMEGDMTRIEDIEAAIAKYPGDLFAIVSFFITHEIRKYTPGSDIAFIQNVRRLGTRLVLTESHIKNLPEYKAFPSANRTYFWYHGLTQDLRPRDYFISSIKNNGFGITREVDYAPLPNGSPTLTTVFADPR